MADRRGGGRRRDPGISPRILSATRDVVVECGVRGASMSAISAAACVGKPTIYLRWPDVRSVVLAAIDDLPAPAEVLPADGLERRLSAAVGADLDDLVSGEHAGFVREVVFESAYDEAIARAVDRTVLAPRHARISHILQEASHLGHGHPLRRVADSVLAITLAGVVTGVRPDHGPQIAGLVQGIAPA